MMTNSGKCGGTWGRTVGKSSFNETKAQQDRVFDSLYTHN